LNNGRIFAISFRDVPNGTLLEVNEDGSETGVIIPEQPQAIQNLVVVGDRIAFTYLHDWGMIVALWTVTGQYIGRLDIPVDGTIRLLLSPGSDALFLTYESFSEPLTTFEFLADAGRADLWHEPLRPLGRRTCYIRPFVATSHDGTRIPLMLVDQGKTTLEDNAPVIMTGYGGFGTSVTPQYSVLVSIMLELESTFVLSRIRGGGEFGEAWHDAGKRRKRQNAFDDFIAAAEWLCAEGVTTSKRLGILGGSNAGLLVGAVLTQRPELFGAVVCIAPLLDMVRYEKFDHASRWRHEYGSVDNAEDFRALHAYSPYHHVEDDTDYPAVLFISGDRDDRCNPAHVRKMAARLQQRDAQTHPILVDYSSDRGHSPVLPLSVRIESLARRITFLYRTLAVKPDRSSR
jgi:prolyl oligopeptidase